MWGKKFTRSACMHGSNTHPIHHWQSHTKTLLCLLLLTTFSYSVYGSIWNISRLLLSDCCTTDIYILLPHPLKVGQGMKQKHTKTQKYLSLKVRTSWSKDLLPLLHALTPCFAPDQGESWDTCVIHGTCIHTLFSDNFSGSSWPFWKWSESFIAHWFISVTSPLQTQFDFGVNKQTNRIKVSWEVLSRNLFMKWRHAPH